MDEERSRSRAVKTFSLEKCAGHGILNFCGKPLTEYQGKPVPQSRNEAVIRYAGHKEPVLGFKPTSEALQK